ncbi:MAG: hypothetical protein U9Q03_01960 [Patescibacteria group bacterium]|nr:hypothetical protein [Patescibacteria group bacterium]
MTRMLSVMTTVLTMSLAGCAGSLDGVTRDTAPPYQETTPTEMPVNDDADDTSEDPLGEASILLVSSTHGLSRVSDAAGISDDRRWGTAVDFWYREVQNWLREADGTLFENPDRGGIMTDRRRMSALLDLRQNITELRDVHRDLEAAFDGIGLGPDIIVESMPDVEEALERADRAIDQAEGAVDTLTDRIGR